MMKYSYASIRIQITELILLLSRLSVPGMISIKRNQSTEMEYKIEGKLLDEGLYYSVSRECITFITEGWKEDVEEFLSFKGTVDGYLRWKFGEEYNECSLKQPLSINNSSKFTEIFRQLAEKYGVDIAR